MHQRRTRRRANEILMYSNVQNFITGLPYGNPVGKWVDFSFFVPCRENGNLSLPCLVLVLCLENPSRIFGRFKEVVEMHNFYQADTVQTMATMPI